MRELATYVGALLMGLNAISLVSIFLFDYKEKIIGGQWANAWFNAMVSIPIVLAAGLGYAVGAYIRNSRRQPSARPCLVGAVGALISAALVFGISVVHALTPSSWYGWLFFLYFVLVGLVTVTLTSGAMIVLGPRHA